MKIFIGSDHGAFELKETLKAELKNLGIDFEDCGCADTTSVDYPDIAKKTCKKILSTPNSLGVLMCGTGIGISIAANKIKGIRAALCHTELEAELARKHNDSNVLCLGGRIIGPELAKSILRSYLKHTFEGGRHEGRIRKISALEC